MSENKKVKTESKNLRIAKTIKGKVNCVIAKNWDLALIWESGWREGMGGCWGLIGFPLITQWR